MGAVAAAIVLLALALALTQGLRPTAPAIYSDRAGDPWNRRSATMSFAVRDPDRLPSPRALPQPTDERARAVAREKEARADFKHRIEAAGLRR